MSAAVLFLVFNRPDTTARVFEAIRAARPSRLYVAADGPRDLRQGEAERCADVRSIATAVDWPCEVKTFFRETNLGCREAVSSAVTWFFANEEEGIILEDDCLPNSSFFSFCQWALNTYRNDKSVWHVNGNNFNAPSELFRNQDVSFSALAQVWGWATWRDRWKHYTGNPFYVSRQADECSPTWLLGPDARRRKLEHLNDLKAGLDTWDYQWQVVILNNHGLCVTSQKNMISNIGDGPDATHTPGDRRSHLPTQEIATPLQAHKPQNNTALTEWYGYHMGLRRDKNSPRTKITEFVNFGRRCRDEIFSSYFFSRTAPIIIASTGRSGSTMLFEAVAESFVTEKMGYNIESSLGRRLLLLSKRFTDRIVDVPMYRSPIHKTHDLFEDNRSKSAKFVFVYGDPFESAKSVEDMTRTHGSIWLDEHLYHLRSEGKLSELYEKDILNYEKQIISWMSSAHEKVFPLYYEDIWLRNDELSDFIGFNIKLPAKQTRKNRIEPLRFNKRLFDHLRAVMETHTHQLRSVRF